MAVRILNKSWNINGTEIKNDKRKNKNVGLIVSKK